MENREGYKKTELGWIPEDWDFNNLYSVSHKIWIGLVTTMTTNYVDYGIPLIRNNNIKENYIQKNEMIFLRNDFAEEHNSRRVKKGDIVSVHTGDICTSAIIDDELDGAHGFATLNTTVKESIISNTYLCWYLNSVWAKKQAYALATGDGRGNLNMKEFKKITLPLPPLKKQKKIASILTTVDDKISSIEAQIQQTEQLKKGLMAKLLTEGIGHTEFKDTEIGRIPKAWEVSELGKHIVLISGQHINAGDYNEDGNGIAYITGPADYPNGRIIATKFTLKPQSVCKKGDILMTCKGSGAGSLTIAEMDCCISRQIMAIRPQSLNVNFTFSILKMAELNFRKNAIGLIPGINRPELLDFNIPLPPLPEQQQIASILSGVDNKLDVLQSKKTSYSTLKKGLMAKLLTGQMRVKI